MSTDCVVVVPMRGRAHMVAGLAESLAASTDRARLLLVTGGADSPASTLEVAQAARDADVAWLSMPPRSPVGDYACKINAGYLLSDEPLIFTGAIDLHFTAGWLEACQEQLAADDRIGVVGTVDGCNPRTATGDTSTHSLVTRTYANACGTIDQRGRILHEGYWHEMVDDELVATARHRGAYAHAFNALVTHRHWSDGGRPRDHVDADHELRMVAGRRLFNQRAPLWAAA